MSGDPVFRRSIAATFPEARISPPESLPCHDCILAAVLHATARALGYGRIEEGTPEFVEALTAAVKREMRYQDFGRDCGDHATEDEKGD